MNVHEFIVCQFELSNRANIIISANESINKELLVHKVREVHVVSTRHK